MKCYRKPELHSAKYALYGPCTNDKTYLILEADKDDVEPNCKVIEADEGWEFLVNYLHPSILKVPTISILDLVNRS